MLVIDGSSGVDVRTRIAGLIASLVEGGELVRAARALARMRAAAALLPEPQRARAAVADLDRLSQTHVIPATPAVLPSLDAESRSHLIEFLGALGESVVPLLCDLLATEHRAAARCALERLTPEFPNAVLAFVRHPEPQVVRTCLELIAASGHASCVPGVLPALRHADVGVRREALRTVTALSGARAAEVLTQALPDPSAEEIGRASCRERV